MNEPTKTTWTIDPGHSAVQFKVKHLAIANVCGAFTAFAGTVQTDRDDFADARVQLEIEAASLGTNNERRDAHLQSDVFFDVPRFPALSFNGLLHKTGEAYALAGTLTIRGVSQPITLPAAFTGTGKGRWGDTRTGFEATGRLNRTDFGLSWNMPTELGSLLIGEEIELHLTVELIQEEKAAAGLAATTVAVVAVAH